MAADIKPSDWLASYTYDGTNLVIPRVALTGAGSLTAAEANATTGDIRRIV